jgi:hypothetical protein
MRVLIACEFSGIVRDAFAARGHDAWSCDLLPSESPSHEFNSLHGGGSANHIQGDVFGLTLKGWDLLTFHWPCTYLLFSGFRWINNPPPKPNPAKIYGEERRKMMIDHAHKFKRLLDCGIPKIAGENPRMCKPAREIVGEPSQLIRPCQYGDDAQKSTFLWLRNLPKLEPTNIVQTLIHTSKSGRKWDKWFFDSSLISNLDKRSKFRSRTFPGIALAMAEQWG